MEQSTENEDSQNMKKYSEQISWIGIPLIFISISIFLFVLFFWFYYTSHFTLILWNLIIISILFIFISIVFRSLKISIDQEKLSISYGFIKYKILISKIKEFSIDDKYGIKYGGYGIRLGKKKGLWFTAFILPGTKRISLIYKKKVDLMKNFIFSTNNPDAIISQLEKYSKN
jgi:hypothetical protein